MPTYLALFTHEKLEFRLPELHSIARLEGLSVADLGPGCCPEHFQQDQCFVHVELPSDQVAKRMAHRMILLKGFYDVFASGTTYEELIQQLKKPESQDRMRPFMGPETTFKVYVDAFGRRYSHKEKLEIFHRLYELGGIPFNGKALMKHPQYRFYVLEDFGMGKQKLDPIRRVFFCRHVATSARGLLSKFDLKKRCYIGTTSMTAELSFLVANQALVQRNSLVYDPFVGTGSLIVSCAHFGARVIGSDIDSRCFTGKEPGKDIESNFQQYEFPARLSGLIRIDFAQQIEGSIGRNSQYQGSVFRQAEMFDAIVADPPYGIREATKKIGRHKFKSVPEEFQEDHICGRIHYSVVDLLQDLTEFAARMLRMGGRLCYWLPTTDEYKPSDVPQHPCFVLVANSEQVLTRVWRRRLITLEKVKSYKEYITTEKPSQNADPSESSALPAHAFVRERVMTRSSTSVGSASPQAQQPSSS